MSTLTRARSPESTGETATNATATRAGSPTSMQKKSEEAEKRIPDNKLQPGVYYIESDQNRNMVLDLAGYDWITILAFPKHGGDNQKWEFAPLGPGYSIKSVLKGTYITLNTGAIENGSLIASPYPVSWELEADGYETGLWRIRWPRSNFIFDLPDINDHIVNLGSSYPFKPTRLWRLVAAEPEQHETLEFTTHSPKELKAQPPVVTTADTIVDVEGLKLGGNGEMSITTTTTTVTTSVTKIKRLGVP